VPWVENKLLSCDSVAAYGKPPTYNLVPIGVSPFE
jgi:hypothetical protein